MPVYSIENLNAVRASDHDLARHSEKKAMFDDADRLPEGHSSLLWHESGLGQVAVQDVVLAVCNIWFAVIVDTQLGRKAVVAKR